MSSLWLAHSCGPFWRGKFLGIGDVLACDIRRPNQWSGSRHLRGGRWDEILDAEYTKSSSIKSRRHSAPSPRWRFQQLSSPKWPARMRSSSPKRTHIIGRAELNSQTLVVIVIIVEESNVNTRVKRLTRGSRCRIAILYVLYFS
jgi:hypothetical protein